MNIKLITTSLLASALFAFSAAHAKLPTKPEACPSVSAIQSVGIELVGKIDDKNWAAGVMSNSYGTTESWTFVIKDMKAKDEAEARAKAAEAMQTLGYQLGPIPHSEPDGWGCLYKSDKGYFIFAITPVLSFGTAITKRV